MYKRHFNAITHKLRFTNTNPPPYIDKFRKIIQMLNSWNDHMTSIFFASWTIYLDDFMSIWNIIWTYPECIFCPQSPIHLEMSGTLLSVNYY